jgi:hypothetical protein
MFDFIWYLLSPFTLISFPSSNDSNDDDDAEHSIINNNKLNNTNISQFQNYDSVHKPILKSVNIPYYIQGENEDSIELQIKSLVYVFHKFKISNLKPFLKINDLTDDYDFDYLLNNSSLNSSSKKFKNTVNNNNNNNKGILLNDKLDRIYNVDHFKNQLLNDPHRILIDYTKNKFRSLLILSDLPKEFADIPSLNTSNFNFIILKSNDSIEKYIDIIVNKSGIYSEHRINNKIKIKILMKIINRQWKHLELNNNGNNNLDNNIIQFSKDDRAHIIKSYLQKLAVHVQIQRIYKAALKQKERELKNRRFQYSNDKSIQSYKSLKSERSRIMLLPDSSSSPIKNDTTNINLNLNASNPNISQTNSSISIIELDDTNNSNNTDYPYYSDAADSQASSSTSSVNFAKMFTTEEKHVCFEQSKMAVRIRIERERTLLLY